MEIIEIRDINSKYGKLWNCYVSKKPDFKYSDLIEWKEIYREAYNIQSSHFVALEESRVMGNISLFLFRPFLLKSRFVACPISLEGSGGFHFENEEAKNALKDAIYNQLRVMKANYAEIHTLQGCGLPEEMKSDYANYLLVLEADKNAYWSALDSDERSAIRKAKRNNLEIRYTESLPNFFHTLHMGMKRHGVPWHNIKFYRLIIKYFKEKIKFIGIKYKEKNVASAMIFRYKEDVLAIVNMGSQKNDWPLRCNDLLYWGIIEYCYERGIRRIDMGRSLQGSSQAKFKLKWGAQPSSIYYNYVIGNKDTRFNMYYEGNFYNMATYIWRRLPLCITKNVGYFFLPYLS